MEKADPPGITGAQESLALFFVQILFRPHIGDMSTLVKKHESKPTVFIGSPYLAAPKVLISGFSFTLIPSVWDFIFITNTRIIDKQGTTVAEYKNEDGATLWIWLFVLPFGDKGFDMNRDDILSNLIKDSLIHISKNNEHEKLIDQKL